MMPGNRIPLSMLAHQEAHIFGVLVPAYGRFRFGSVFEEEEFLRLTWRCGLPPLWCCWHQGTTPFWPTSVEQLPLVTVGLWQQFSTGRMPKERRAELNQPQDPRPLLGRATGSISRPRSAYA